MRLAVFTNQFPGPVCTFFARDMRGLIDAGMEIDVFPIYPLDPGLWRYVPDILNESILPRNKVHHLRMAQCVQAAKRSSFKQLGLLSRDAFSINTSAVMFGAEPFAKTTYALLKAWIWAQQYPNTFDHVLAYWGNYAGTGAYVYNRLCEKRSPFSIFLHASIDLYRKPVYMRQKMRDAANIITCSDFNRKFITTHFNDIAGAILRRIYVHHHGVDFGSVSFNLDNRPKNKVIAVGRLTKHKGFQYLIPAVAGLAKRGVPVELEIVGEGEQGETLRLLSRELNIEPRVNFRGWIQPDEVLTAIRNATVLVHSSPDLGDGVPNVIKEAMAVGTPVIGSMVAGIPELLDHGSCGMLVPPKDAKALAHGIETLLINEGLRRRYANAARKRSQKRYDLWQNGRDLAKVLAGKTVTEEAGAVGQA